MHLKGGWEEVLKIEANKKFHFVIHSIILVIIMEKRFPENFYWGAATSAHQVEGGNRNDWSEWEKENAERLAREAEKKFGYLPNWSGIKEQAQDPQNYISGRACDHYNHYEADFDIAKSLGHNAHRFSIEWSRVEPEEGKWDEKEIEHYRQVIRALRSRGLEPFVTLWHWTDPLWIRDIGGWENKKTIEYFSRYVEKIIDELGSEIKFWLPINEPTIYTGHSYIIGVFPPQIKNYFRGNRVLKNLIKAHKVSYGLIHQKLGSGVNVGVAHNLHHDVPYREKNLFDRFSAKILDYVRERRSMKWTKNYEDFIGINYYYRDTVKFTLGGRYILIDIKNPNTEISDLGWDIYATGIYYILKSLKNCNKPIYITENGLADAKDEKRERFIKEHLYWVAKAIKEGVDVRGYFYWSLLDNFEWDKGFWPRFGLVEIDYKTMERKIRSSARVYAEICKNNVI